jgi:hypothetical protein
MNSWPARSLAVVLGCVLAFQLPVVAQSQSETRSADTVTIAALPDAPSALMQQDTAPESNDTQTPTAPAKTPAPSQAQNPRSELPAQPQGTAAAAIQPTTGTAGSRPSGAAIAPAKQKRNRSLLIKLGALAGAGIAVGTVFALSSAGSSKPPGAN